jgi:hypothetical protein
MNQADPVSTLSFQVLHQQSIEDRVEDFNYFTLELTHDTVVNSHRL